MLALIFAIFVVADAAVIVAASVMGNDFDGTGGC